MINFLIVGTQRTGSSALGDGIGLHPQVACGWEWTLRTAPWHAIRVADAGLRAEFSVLGAEDRAHMGERYGPQTRAIGFRRLFRSSDKWLAHPSISPALWLDRLEAHINWLGRRSDIRVIHIVREDNLGWLRSRSVARQSGIYFGRPYPADTLVSVDLTEARRRIAAKDWVDQRLSTIARCNPYLAVSYDAFRRDNLSILSRVLEFLDLDPTLLPSLELHMRAKPQSSAAIESNVQNHLELEKFLLRAGLLRSEVPSHNALR